MISELQTTTGESLRRRLILDCIVRWRWAIVLVFLVHMIIASLLLSIDGNEGPPVLILLVGFHMTGIIFFSHDFKNGWTRVLKSLPLTRDQGSRLLRFAALLPAGIWAVVAILVILVSLFCGLSFEKLTPLFSALVYGSAASAATLYYTGWKSKGRDGEPYELRWLLLLIPAWFIKIGHPATILFALPLVAIGFVGWRRMEQPVKVLQPRKDTASRFPILFLTGKSGILNEDSRPVLKWLLKQMAIGFLLGCFISILNFGGAAMRPENAEVMRISANLLEHSVFAVIFSGILSANQAALSLRLWRCVPLSGRTLTALFITAPVCTALAGVSGVLAPIGILSGFRICPSPSDVLIASSCCLVCSLIAPAVIRFQKKTTIQFVLTTVFFLSILGIASLSQQVIHPAFSLAAGIIALLTALIWMRHLLSQTGIYRDSSSG